MKVWITSLGYIAPRTSWWDTHASNAASLGLLWEKQSHRLFGCWVLCSVFESTMSEVTLDDLFAAFDIDKLWQC
jgi:hypothetical protein